MRKWELITWQKGCDPIAFAPSFILETILLKLGLSLNCFFFYI